MAMQYYDRVGYDVLLSKYSVICKSSLDPSDLARSLLQGGIINQGVADQAGSRATITTQSEKIEILLDAVLRSGAPNTFECFLNAMRSDRTVEWLVDQLKTEYDRRKRPQVECDGSPLTPDPNNIFKFLPTTGTSTCVDPSHTYAYAVPSRSNTDPPLPNGRDVHHSTTTLGEDDLVDVLEKVMDMATIWKPLGQALRLRAADLDTIGSRHPDNITECLRDTLHAWLQQRYDVAKFGPPTWNMLSKAVEQRAGGNNPALAKTLTKQRTL